MIEDEHIAGKHIEDNLESPIALCYNCKHPLAYGVHRMKDGHHVNEGFIERVRACRIRGCECVMIQPRFVLGKFGEAIIQ